jgi:cell division protein DivIC
MEELKEEITEERDRAKELQEMKAYVQTKKYVEEVAREKLGLVYKDEIIFESENSK